MTGTMPREGNTRRAAVAAALATLVLAGLAIAPAPAAASTVALVDRGANQNELALLFRAGRGERNRVTITFDEFAVTVTDAAGVASGDPNCTRSSPITVVCQTPIDAVPPSIGRADISLGDRNDTLTLRSNLPGTCDAHLTPNPVVFVDGGPGNDRITGGPGQRDLLCVILRVTLSGVTRRDDPARLADQHGPDRERRRRRRAAPGQLDRLTQPAHVGIGLAGQRA